jgi:hypothetical protein
VRVRPNSSSARPALWPTVHVRARRGTVTVAGNGVVARVAKARALRGQRQGHEGGGGGASGKKIRGGAHRGGRVSGGWWGAAGVAAFQWRAASMGWRRPQGQSYG